MESKPFKSQIKKKRYSIESRFSETDWSSLTVRKQGTSAIHSTPIQQSREWESQHDVNQLEDESRN